MLYSHEIIEYAAGSYCPMKATARLPLACVCIAAVYASACGRSTNLLLGRVEAIVSTHTVVVTDCYRTSVPLR